MINHNDDKLSALVDNEVAEWELKSVVQLLKHDRELQACWSNYHLIGDAMRGSLPRHLCPDLADRISNALENEPHHFNPQTSSPSTSTVTQTRTRAAAGFALAASISAVAIIGVMGIDHDAGMPGGQDAPVVAGGTGMLSPDSRPVLSSLLNEFAVANDPVDGRGMAGIHTVSGIGAQPTATDLYDYLKNYQQHSMQSGNDPLTYLRVVSHGAGP
jgi:hypothetical protein